MASVAIGERTITSKPKQGQVMRVTTPDHYVGTIEFESGVVGSVIQSLAMRNAPKIEPFTVYGTKATMNVPDPNSFDNKVLVKKEGRGGLAGAALRLRRRVRPQRGVGGHGLRRPLRPPAPLQPGAGVLACST